MLLSAPSLGKIGDKRAVDPLIKALRDSNEDVREDAAEALGEIGDPRAVNILSELVHDEDKIVRKRAKEALEKIKKRKSSRKMV